MARQAPREGLRASLLDRLTDEKPGTQRESSRRSGAVSMQELRQTVLRDMAWLLNTANLACAQDLEEYPEVVRSVVNYGIPDLVGLTTSGLDVARLEQEIKQAVLEFEPRIVPRSLRIRIDLPDEEICRNAMSFEIEGQLWADPEPIHITVHSEVDLETGSAVLRDDAGNEAS